MRILKWFALAAACVAWPLGVGAVEAAFKGLDSHRSNGE